MKRWKIILISVILALLLLGGGGICVYRFFIVPRYLEPLLQTAVTILESEEVQKEISSLVKDFSDQGLLDEELLKQYLSLYEKKNKDTVPDTSNEPSPKTNTPSENSVGAKNIKVQENDSGTRYSYSNNTPSTNLITPEESKTSGLVSKSLYQRIKENVAPEDLNRGYQLAAKFNISKVQSLMSNREELKKYVRSVLTDSEYSEVVAFYIKYSYLLEE